MEAKLKQRVVGIAVLVVIVVAVVPFLLRKSPDTDNSVSTTLAPLSTVSTAQPVSPPQQAETQAAWVAPQTTSAKPAASETAASAATPIAAAPQTAMVSQPVAAPQPVATVVTPTVASAESVTSSPVASTVQTATHVPAVHKIKHSAALKKEKAIASKHHAGFVQAWTIQLASFDNKANAHRLITTLRQKGFAAYARTVATKKGTLTRIFVGPELHKSQALKLVSELEGMVHLKGIVVKYQV